jgi:tetratricopeptide (TPR) repeat protein
MATPLPGVAALRPALPGLPLGLEEPGLRLAQARRLLDLAARNQILSAPARGLALWAWQRSPLEREACALVREGRPSPPAEALAARGETEEAARLFAEAGLKDRAAALYEECGHLAAAAELRRELGDFEMAGNLFYRTQAFLPAAQCYEQAHLFTMAEQCYLKAGDNPRAARMAFEAGHWERAVALATEEEDRRAFLARIQAFPDNPPERVRVSLLKARLFLDLGEPSVAATCLDGISPGSLDEEAWYHYLTGRVREALGDAPAAEEAYKKALAVNVSFEDARKRLEAVKQWSARPARQRDRYGETGPAWTDSLGPWVRAEDTLLRTPVLLHRIADPRVLAPVVFEPEHLERLLSLRHASILGLRDALPGPGGLELVHEDFGGRPLGDWVAEGYRPSGHAALEKLRPILEALAEAHRRGKALQARGLIKEFYIAQPSTALAPDIPPPPVPDRAVHVDCPWLNFCKCDFQRLFDPGLFFSRMRWGHYRFFFGLFTLWRKTPIRLLLQVQQRLSQLLCLTAQLAELPIEERVNIGSTHIQHQTDDQTGNGGHQCDTHPLENGRAIHFAGPKGDENAPHGAQQSQRSRCLREKAVQSIKGFKVFFFRGQKLIDVIAQWFGPIGLIKRQDQLIQQS